jgi:hypothetical protein
MSTRASAVAPICSPWWRKRTRPDCGSSSTSFSITRVPTGFILQGTPGGTSTPYYTQGRYAFGAWLGDQGQTVGAIAGPEDGIWPSELQAPEYYTRAGSGSLGAGDINDPFAEHKRSDFITLRDFNQTTVLG